MSDEREPAEATWEVLGAMLNMGGEGRVIKRGSYSEQTGGVIGATEHLRTPENGERSALAPLTKPAVLERVGRALDEFRQGKRYGEITIRIQAGKVIWVDQQIRERVG